MIQTKRITAPKTQHALRCLLIAWLLLSLRGLLAAETPRHAVVFTDKLPGHDEAFARDIAAQVSASGYAVAFVGVSTLTNVKELAATKFDLLVFPGARSLPAAAAPALENFLKQGGDLLALGL